MKIELLFATPKSWNPFSALIRLVDGSKFSHSAIAYGDYDTKLVLHSTRWRVNIETIDLFTKHNKIVETIIVDVNGKDFLRNIMPHMGKQYGYLTIFGIFLQRMFAKVGLDISPPFTDGDKTFVCSEMVIYLLQCSTDYLGHLRPELDGPQQIYEEVKKNEILDIR